MTTNPKYSSNYGHNGEDDEQMSFPETVSDSLCRNDLVGRTKQRWRQLLVEK
jgi:hypothetical protein